MATPQNSGRWLSGRKARMLLCAAGTSFLPFELGRTAEQKPAQLGVLSWSARTQRDDSTNFVRHVAQGSVEAGPTIGADFLLEAGSDLVFAPGTELQRHAFGGALAEAVTDVVPADALTATRAN